MRWKFALCVCIIAASTPAVAQTPARSASTKEATPSPKPAPSGPSTLKGVYTIEQAGRGEDVYVGTCRSCHSPESHTGATFVRNWRGKSLSDLFEFVSLRMPKNDPGTMAAEDVADVVAYLLKMNLMPPGKVEIYPDADSLKQIRIDVKSASSGTSTTKRKTP